jgi:hypothetical protein
MTCRGMLGAAAYGACALMLLVHCEHVYLVFPAKLYIPLSLQKAVVLLIIAFAAIQCYIC